MSCIATSDVCSIFDNLCKRRLSQFILLVLPLKNQRFYEFKWTQFKTNWVSMVCSLVLTYIKNELGEYFEIQQPLYIYFIKKSFKLLKSQWGCVECNRKEFSAQKYHQIMAGPIFVSTMNFLSRSTDSTTPVSLNAKNSVRYPARYSIIIMI